MTIRQLSRLRHLNLKIQRLQEEIKTVRDKAEKTTTSISFMPHGGVTTDCKEELVYLWQILKTEVKKSIIEQQQLEQYISSIEDVLIQNIIAYRFVNGLSWNEISIIMGGNTTIESIKKSAYRYINKSCPQCP